MDKWSLLVLPLCLLVSVTESVHKRRTAANNQCSLQHNGCHYDFVLTTADCAGSGGGGGETRNRWTRDLPVIEQETNDLGEVDVVPVRKLDQLERKLVKMMEALSVRSLRHIRQIKTDLRQMSGSMDRLRVTTPTGLMKGGGGAGDHGCPPEFLGIGTWSSCYRFSSFGATWHEAREYCAAFGADLVAMDTLKEAYILNYLMKSNPEFKQPSGWWTSGNYIVRNRRWMWTTKHHLKPIEFSRWAPGEPNARTTMHCMALSRDLEYLWKDAACTQKYNFVCEIQLM